jgi:putative membrane protein
MFLKASGGIKMKGKILAAAAMVLAPAMLLARPYDCPYFYGMPFRGGGIFMIITAVLIIALLVFLFLQYSRNRNSAGTFLQGNSENPAEILNKRLAKGEITEEEYDRLKAKISG